MGLFAYLLPDVVQPWKTGMGGLGYETRVYSVEECGLKPPKN
jgi:hypothetical protein